MQCVVLDVLTLVLMPYVSTDRAGPTKLHVNPIFEIGPLEPRFSEWLVFEVRSPVANLIISHQDATGAVGCMSTTAHVPCTGCLCR